MKPYFDTEGFHYEGAGGLHSTFRPDRELIQLGQYLREVVAAAPLGRNGFPSHRDRKLLEWLLDGAQ